MKAIVLTQSSQVYDRFIRANKLNKKEYPLVNETKKIFGKKNQLCIMLYGSHTLLYDGVIEMYCRNHNIDMIRYEM